MTETSTSVASTDGAGVDETAAPVYDQLHTAHGDTTIAETVVQKIAVIAAREVPGVYAMGNAAGRAINQLAGRISSQSVNISSGVTVQNIQKRGSACVTHASIGSARKALARSARPLQSFSDKRPIRRSK